MGKQFFSEQRQCETGQSAVFWVAVKKLPRISPIISVLWLGEREDARQEDAEQEDGRDLGPQWFWAANKPVVQ